MIEKNGSGASGARPSPPSITGEPGVNKIARVTDRRGGIASDPARENSLLPVRNRLLLQSDSRNTGKYDGQSILLDGVSGSMTQTPDTAASAGDLISREAHLDLLAAVIAANSGTVLRVPGTADTLTMGELTEQVDALRALPPAPEAGGGVSAQ